MGTLNLSCVPESDIDFPVVELTGLDRELAIGLLGLANSTAVMSTAQPSVDELRGRASLLCDIVQRQGFDWVHVSVQDDVFQAILVDTLEDAGLMVIQSVFAPVVEKEAA